MTSDKVRHYYATHENRIRWAGEYIAPSKLFGTWIEIKMIEDETDKGTWHETWFFPKGIPSSQRESLMHDLRDILNILCEPVYGFSAPYIIQIDKRGRCHLLLALVNDVITTMNLIMHSGELEWVKIG